MKTGRNIEELGKELLRQREIRKDYVADTRYLTVVTDEYGQSNMQIDLNGDMVHLTLNDLAHSQIANRLQIPLKYYNKMRKENPILLDMNINGWFRKTPEKRMVRTLDNKVRAFLSDRYRRLDNLELATTVLPIIQEIKGAQIISCDVTETNMYLKVINKRLKAEVAVNDVVQAGFVISNSEVGLGSLKVEPLIYRLVCKNGLIAKDYTQKKYHVGRQIDTMDAAYEIYSDETLKADDKAFFMKVEDTVRTAVDETKFNLIVEKFRDSKRQSTGSDPIKTVEILADKYTLNKNEEASILRHFIMANDNSAFGLINAVTRASQDVEDYNRATDLERIGGELLALPNSNKILTLPNRSNMIDITSQVELA
ncbi:DUF932 domain-containing protein [Pectinatus brassicae]|uniref:DUF932 domain-containing protein n=1 Tax=Pectinatus brassicae TaxID=862415 RepID=A0A840UPJ0_9FIRM|nr:DUF932 domain-containing protein [Pectinatus brassicae]MBB5336122.1 hypothetical protein [Pectinatus brassicae]